MAVLGPAPQAFVAPTGITVYFGYGIRQSKENQRARLGLTATRGNLEEMVPATQTPSQAPAQEPGSMEQPASP